MKLEIPGCDEGPKYHTSMNLEMRRQKLSPREEKVRASAINGAGAAAKVPNACEDSRSYGVRGMQG